MAPLRERISNALADATALQRLLPEISSSGSPECYLGNAFARAAISGYTESYKVTAREVFKNPEKHHGHIAQAITCAIENHHDWIANDLLDNVMCALHGLDRKEILHYAWRAAAREENIIISTRILKEELRISWLDEPLCNACDKDNAELVSLMVASLMTKGEDERSAAELFQVDEDHPDVLGFVQIHRGRVLQTALEQSVIREFHSITAILLIPYLECVAYYSSRRDRDRARTVLKRIDDKDYANISRELALRLISTNIPQEAKRAISRRLEFNSNTEPKDIRLSVGVQHFRAHKDVLSHWSPYFMALFHGKWTDRNDVSFDKDIISAAALKSVVEFAYSGVYIYRGSDVSAEEKIKQLEDLVAAADYFDMATLREQVEACLGSEE